MTKPLTLSLALDYAPDTAMLEDICENERDSAHEVGKANTTVELSSATLRRYVGAYEFSGGGSALAAGIAGFMGRTQTVALIDGTLYLNALPLIPRSETRFDSTGAAAEFTIGANGAVTRLILSQAEGDATYDRKP